METTYPTEQLVRNLKPIPGVEWEVLKMGLQAHTMGKVDVMVKIVVRDVVRPEKLGPLVGHCSLPCFVSNPQEQVFEPLCAMLIRLAAHEVREWVQLRSNEFVMDPHPEIVKPLEARSALTGRVHAPTYTAPAPFPFAFDSFRDSLPSKSELLALPHQDRRICECRPEQGETLDQAVRRAVLGAGVEPARAKPTGF